MSLGAVTVLASNFVIVVRYSPMVAVESTLFLKLEPYRASFSFQYSL